MNLCKIVQYTCDCDELRALQILDDHNCLEFTHFGITRLGTTIYALYEEDVWRVDGEQLYYIHSRFGPVFLPELPDMFS